MKDAERTRLYIAHIRECLVNISEFTRPGRESLDDAKTYLAVLRCLQTLAESMKRLPEETRVLYPGIEWGRIASFRNVLVHDYMGGFNHDLLWSIIQERLPEIEKAFEEKDDNGQA